MAPFKQVITNLFVRNKNVAIRVSNYLPFLTKVLFVSIIILGGVAGGIIIGYRLFGEKQAVASNIIGDDGVDEKMKLLFGAGNHFPFVNYISMDGVGGNSTELLLGKKSSVIFADQSCEPCQRFMEQWNQIVEPKLVKDAQQVVFLDKTSLVNGNELPDYSKNKIVCLIELDKFRKEYNLTILPTVVVMDETGIVRHIQYGHRGGIDYEILKFLTTHDI